jgi:hypothetical protein
MAVDLHLLGALIPDVDHPAPDLALKINADGGCVSDQLMFGLIERHYQTAFVTPRALGQELQPQEVGIDGITWDVVIVEASGAMSGAVLSHGGGMLMFGTCSN